MRRLDLSGEWSLIGSHDETRALPAQVPGDTHTALWLAGEIESPYWGTNELDQQWIGREDWSFLREFEIEAEWLDEAAVFLHCESLDTIASVEINGRRAGDSENMFCRRRFDVKRYLRAGTNTLRITFKSAERTAQRAARRLDYPVPTSSFPIQSPHRNLVRKVQCHGGWDWGPCLMVAGIYGEIYLGATSTGRIEHVVTRQTHGKNNVAVEVEVEVLAPVRGQADLQITLGDEVQTQHVRLAKGSNTYSVTLTIDDPHLWWPNGYGGQPLYPLTVRIAGDTVQKRLGLRTLELVSEEDEIGRSFLFCVNGVDIYCKGANWIPTDSLPSRQTEEVLRDLLESAAAAHMNMLRVWGGGQYESDRFYDVCDELGLLVWQDFMFSCSLYPATPEFLANVREEAEYQVRRLRDHACLALWCGNNENVGALNWYQESRENRDRYVIDYDRLTEGVLGEVVDTHDPTRAFWPSSPSAGRHDYSDCWHDDSRGDMHYWSVWHEGKSFDAYHAVTPRFCSEFGYQSFPSLDTIRTYAAEDQFNVTAPVMEHHQRNPGGNSKIIEMFSRYFRMPDGFANFVYLSQVQQGLAIRTAVEHWRRLRPTCMGTLYWQLNDCWPVASWASIEYGGKWKLLHYLARRFYAPILLTPYQTDQGRLEIWGVNDHTERRDVEVTVRILDFQGDLLARESFHGVLPAAGSKRLKSLPLADLAPHPRESFAVISYEGDGRRVDREHFFSVWKTCDLAVPRISVTCERQGDGIMLDVSTDKPAFYVSLDVAEMAGTFSDNCFVLLPGETRHVTFMPKASVRLDTFRKALTVSHLRDTYQ